MHKNTQRHPWKNSTFNSGVDRNNDPELNPNIDKGVYYDATNARPNEPGAGAARVKIKGEEVLHPPLDNRCELDTGSIFQPPFEELPSSYYCVGSENINGDVFEVFCDTTESFPPIFRINGKVVAMSERIPYTHEIQLQIEKNEDAIGGEVFMTDFKSSPLIFSIDDLKKNSGLEGGVCSTKYFSDFNLQEHVLFISGTTDNIVLTGVSSSATADYTFSQTGVSGVPVGSYAYSFRFSDGEGNRTAFTPPTPFITVGLDHTDQRSDVMPGQLSHSGFSNDQVYSSYGIKMKLRINNERGYKFIEVKRIQNNNGAGIFTPGASVICGIIELESNDFKVIEIFDKYGFEEDLGEDETFDSLSVINSFKTIHYEDRRLWIGNIKYASRVLKEEDVDYVTGTRYEPIVEKLGKIGHTDPIKSAYFKNRLSSEKNGSAVIFWDENGRYSFPFPIDGMEEVETPSRRDQMSQDQMDLSWNGFPVSANNNGNISAVHEIMDMNDAVKKTNVDQHHNILKDGKRALSNVIADMHGVAPLSINPSFIETDILPAPMNYVKAGLVSYRPFTPVNQFDQNSNSLNHRINLLVGSTDSASSRVEYNPRGYAPNYYAKGIAFRGFSKMPSWAKGFSIVRTETAGQVVGQGLAFYKLNSSEGGFGAGTTKTPNQAWVHIPDIDPVTGINPEWYNEFISNPSNFQVRVEAPYGYFDEVYNFKSGTFNGSDTHIDMILHARHMKETFDSGTNSFDVIPFESNTVGIGGSPSERHIGFGKWRRSDSQTEGIFANAQNSTRSNPINIVSVNQNPTYKGRGNYLELTFDRAIFWHSAPGGVFSNEESVKRWHEPVYIISIIRKNVGVSQSENVTRYYNYGHFQKIDSVIGVSNGAVNQRYELVGERWEDCVDRLNSIPSGNPYLDLNRFIHVEQNDGTYRKWLCVSNKTEIEIETILTAIQNNGFAVVTDSSGIESVYGVYKHIEENNSVLISFTQFNGNFDLSLFIPPNDRKIKVLYDNRIPVKVFDGDSFVANAVFAPIDTQTTSNGNHPSNGAFTTNIGFPIHTHYLNPRTFIANKGQGGNLVTNKIQDQMKTRMSSGFNVAHARIRQMIVSYVCESRANLALKYNDDTNTMGFQTFPLKNYVMRPHEWNQGTDGIRDEYWTSYGEAEADLFGWGGFRFIGLTNIDKSKTTHTENALLSAPKVGFKEQNNYPTRIHWSLERATNVQNAPGLRTFPELNFVDIGDENGEIKYMTSVMTDRGRSIVIFTESGVNEAFYGTRPLDDSEGETQLTILSQPGISRERFVSSSVGCPDEFWRTIKRDGNSIRWIGADNMYEYQNGVVSSIGDGYFKTINKFINAIGPGYTDGISSYLNRHLSEHVITFRKKGLPNAKNYKATIKEDPLYIIQTDQQLPPNSPPISSFYTNAPNTIDIQSNNSVVVVTALTPVENQSGVHVGRLFLSLVQADFKILVPTYSPYPVKVLYSNPNQFFNFSEINIQPGECFEFIPDPSENISPANTYSTGFIAVKSTGNENTISYITPDKCDSIVYNTDNKLIQGRYAYSFDSYCTSTKRVFGSRNGTTFELNKGDFINGEPILFSLYPIHNINQVRNNEFIKYRINGDKPTEIQFYMTEEEIDVLNYLCRKNQFFAKAGYEFFIPRQEITKNRLQGRVMISRIIHNLAGDYKLVSVGVQHKEL